MKLHITGNHNNILRKALQLFQSSRANPHSPISNLSLQSINKLVQFIPQTKTCTGRCINLQYTLFA